MNIPPERAAASAGKLYARIVILGATGAGLEALSYRVPDEFTLRLRRGHRVLVEVRSRRLTGIVLDLESDPPGTGELKPIIEILEPQPLFDGPHLELIKFLGSYYMTGLGEAFRAVVPATARVESRRLYSLVRAPDPLRAATFNAAESAIVQALSMRPMTARQLRARGAPEDFERVVERLMREGLVEPRDGTRGRHRQAQPTFARFKGAPDGVRLRSARHRLVLQRLAAAHPAAVAIADLRAETADVHLILRALARRNLVELIAEEPCPMPPHAEPRAQQLTLNWEQTAAFDEIVPAVRESRFASFLLWGVTGSGKTEVYLQLAAAALAAGRQVLVLEPEIALADEVVQAFQHRFGRLAAVLHSAQNVAERWAAWMAAIDRRCRVIIGPRSAVFAPIQDLGLIVVDEEHDPAYKQEEGIRYNARDLAVVLARLSGCPVVLGSATPSAESYANARRGRYKLVRITQRVAGRALAAVELIDLRAHLRTASAPATAASPPPTPQAPPTGPMPAPDPTAAGSPVPLAPALLEALRANLEAGGQSIVFLNRRGYHNFLQCHLCGNVIACRNCSVSLTFHLRDRSLRCHFCGESAPAPEGCPECGGPGLEGQGFGTERLAGTLATLLPSARIARMDSDTSGRREARAALLRSLRSGTIDILVGTQMITKGFDFPGITLVGVVLADLSLNLPDFRSAERTFQLLTQVAGRAGRSDRTGRVVIQTYAPHHYSIRAAADQDYARFIRRELELRRELRYPPFSRMALVRIEGRDQAQVAAVAGRVATLLGRSHTPAELRVLGPAPAPIERLRGRYRWQVVIKAVELKIIRDALAMTRTQTAAAARDAAVKLLIDIDPLNMM